MPLSNLICPFLSGISILETQSMEVVQLHPPRQGSTATRAAVLPSMLTSNFCVNMGFCGNILCGCVVVESRNFVMRTGNMPHMQQPRPNNVKNVALCHLSVM